MPELIIPARMLDEAADHCMSCLPDEACGILAGRGNEVTRLYRMTNSEPSPASYFMEPAEQFRVMKEMRRDRLELLAIFHSHPQSPACPSATDIRLASYPDAVYLIIGLMDQEAPDIRSYEIMDGVVKEVSFTIK